MDIICDYDEGYTKSEAEEIGFCGRCRVSTCRNKEDLKEKLIAALIKEFGTGKADLRE